MPRRARNRGDEDWRMLDLLKEHFTPAQVKALLAVFSMRGHSHEIEDIEGLDDELEELEGDT